MNNQPILKPYSKDKYIVNEEFTHHGVTVPKGFLTDGLSIPQALRSFTYSPFSPVCIRAGVIHDNLYTLAQDKKAADKLFKKILLEDGASKFQAQVMYLAVKFFGASHFGTSQD